ncbi:putative F-box/LRR-repeat protein 23 [Juglans microcarpa x Juglans regia]|uniref:putative F-box/LRR-repeat protein 23 n=1 Tax=Juglans microcarpa x Juglans regia TaxID=2249226 RepID=UPI001B7E5E10|nr:putative F-box/LRR-repeat protein 23 [Juglans microcarpa x Juglans regia]XP_041028737.1 putative F-box/LRR-repeat protein 23 [Juglans microcarpa x Juglans regia]XP_041028738.1 putative F-box/LRR-repeat protein 23 [Juglans microcarpa x Juglans regia]XP_041028739.1 putative F-box/LRR-repeat protein 23 [Juglans microcarpa x Juglans regia]
MITLVSQKEKPLTLIMDSPPPAPSPTLPPPPHHLLAEQYRNWLDLPRELMESILKKLSVIEILTSAQKVCLPWRDICNDPYMWRTLNMVDVQDSRNMPYDLEAEMCRQAVDLSCGQLVRIKVGRFCTDRLLEYITESSRGLRYLGLSWCEISETGFSEAVANIPLLEELELSYCSWTENFPEVVGRSCPHLKSLKLRREVYGGDHECDLSANAIAENMPGLVILHLVGNKLTDNGLLAILDGCPHLQTLILRNCRCVSPEGDVGRKCSERRKNLLLDYSNDHQEFDEMPEVDSGYHDYYDNDPENLGLA